MQVRCEGNDLHHKHVRRPYDLDRGFRSFFLSFYVVEMGVFDFVVDQKVFLVQMLGEYYKYNIAKADWRLS
jgi:hypothetical protein